VVSACPASGQCCTPVRRGANGQLWSVHVQLVVGQGDNGQLWSVRVQLVVNVVQLSDEAVMVSCGQCVSS